MTNEEQLLAAMEEVSNQLSEIKKLVNRPVNSGEVNLKPISDSLDSMREYLQKLNYERSTRDAEYEKIKKHILEFRDLLLFKQREVTHRYIEVKEPKSWIITIALYFLVSSSICFFVIYRNAKLKETISILQPNDFKYRYLKFSSLDIEYLRKRINNTADLVYSVDDYYNTNKKDLESFVISSEEETRRMNEANTIAKQKELEATKAKEEAKKLRQKYGK